MTPDSSSRFSARRALWNIRAVLVLLLVAATVFGQTDNGALTVSVADPGGAAIADAIVTVTNFETRVSRSQKTDKDGRASFVDLEVGRYIVRVAVANFQEQTSEAEVIAGKEQKLPITLGVELTPRKATATATSTSAAAAVAAATTLPEQGQEDLSALPNLNNDLTPILQVVPGAVPIGSSALGRIIFDGRGKEQQTVKLDTLDVTPLVDLPSGDSAIGVLDSFLKPSVALDPNPDRIGVTEVAETTDTKTGAFEPFYGPGTGVLVEGQTFRAPGSWTFQVYERLLNDALNARNTFDFEGKNGIRRNMFGGQAGGAIYPDKAFLFVGYEGIRGRTEQNIYEAVPTDALCRCGAGPVAPFLRGFLAPGTVFIPGASLNPDFLVARRRARSASGSNAWDARLDVKLSPRNFLTFRLTRQSAETNVPDGVTGRRQRQRLILMNALAKLTLRRGDYTHVLKIGFNQPRVRVNTEVASTTDQSLLRSAITVGGSVNTVGLPLLNQSVPMASLGGLVKNIGRGFDLNPTAIIGGYDFSGDFKNGRHTLRFGVELRSIRLGYDRLGGLTYGFPNVAALRAGTPGNVNFLSDLSGPSPFGSGTGPRRAQQEFYLGYFQMTSKFGGLDATDPNLTLTYGLRYDYFGPARERDGRAAIVDPQTGELLPPGTPFYRSKKDNFEPRFGLAYHIRSRNRLFADAVLRAGVGVYSGAPRIGDLMLPIDSNRFSTGITGGLFPFTPEDVTRSFVNDPLTRQFQPLTFARDFTTPERVYKWEVNLTPKFWGVYNFSIGYTGNVGRNLPLAGVANQIVSVLTNPDPTQAAIVLRQLDIVRGGQVFKPYGEFFYRTSRGRSSYNAMLLSFVRDRKAQLSDSSLPRWLVPRKLSAQYTLARSVGNVSGTVVSNPLDFDSDYGYNAVDARHSFALQVIYNLWEAFTAEPPKKDPTKSDLLWGWTIAPTLTVRSGLPVTVLLDRPDVVYLDASGNVFSSPAAGRRAVINTPGGGASGASRVPDLIPGVNPYLRDGSRLLNPEAFAIPAPGTFGNLKRGALRGPALFKVDLTIARQIFAKEKVTSEIKVEMFNLFNRTNFNNPTASLPNALGTNVLDNQLQSGAPFTRLAAKTFGIYSAADTSRQLQFTLTFKFNGGF
jgi:hypothetical protein